MTTANQAVVVMLTDDQLAEEISETQAQVCCPSYAAAAAVLCGCHGAAGEYLERLLGEAQRREDGAA